MGQRVETSSTRRSPRIRLQVPVFVRGTDASGAEFIELTKTLNISATGACIASAHILRPEQTVHLTIPAPTPTSCGRSWSGKCASLGWSSSIHLSNLGHVLRACITFLGNFVT